MANGPNTFQMLLALISSFRKKISSMNSQVSKEINFESLFCNLEHVYILRNFAEEISLMERCDWSVDSVYRHRYEASYMAFESLFPL